MSKTSYIIAFAISLILALLSTSMMLSSDKNAKVLKPQELVTIRGEVLKVVKDEKGRPEALYVATPNGEVKLAFFGMDMMKPRVDQLTPKAAVEVLVERQSSALNNEPYIYWIWQIQKANDYIISYEDTNRTILAFRRRNINNASVLLIFSIAIALSSAAVLLKIKF